MKEPKCRKDGMCVFSLSMLSLSPPPSALCYIPPITTGHLCGPKLMGSSPRDGPVATVCLSLSTSNKLRPSHHVGMLMYGALGGRGDWTTEVPICGRSEPGRGEKLIPGARQSV